MSGRLVEVGRLERCCGSLGIKGTVRIDFGDLHQLAHDSHLVLLAPALAALHASSVEGAPFIGSCQNPENLSATVYAWKDWSGLLGASVEGFVGSRP